LAVTVLVLSLALGIGIAIAIIVFKAKANKRDDVVMDWEGLRFTRTELIEGYSQNARRHPLKGLTARVEDTGFHRGGPNQHRIHVIVEGPDTAIVKSSRSKSRFSDTAARKFVATLNMASRQLS
jgi:hypothetical protein